MNETPKQELHRRLAGAEPRHDHEVDVPEMQRRQADRDELRMTERLALAFTLALAAVIVGCLVYLYAGPNP